jgi:peptidoglycan/LPS O-acetylase OafA/YrhL
MPAATLEPPKGNPRFPQIDGLRAIAALLVFAYHVTYQTRALVFASYADVAQHLDVGVAVFFAISGFLLYRPFVAARMGARRRRLRDYARARALRIAPAYWVALTVCALYPGLTGVFTGDWWWYYGFLQVYSPERALLGLPVAWTLAVEVSFYLLLPVYAFLVGLLLRTPLRRWWMPFELTLLIVLSAALLKLQEQQTTMSIIATFDWFAVGMALAVLSVWVGRRATTPRWVLLVRRWPWALWACAIAAFAFLCYGIDAFTDPTVWRYRDAVYVSLLRALVSLLLLAPLVLASDRVRALPGRFMTWRPVAWLGIVSYGIYLWHLPVLVAVWRLHLDNAVLGNQTLSYLVFGLPPTIALAALSWYLIERPALSLKDGWKRRRPASRAEGATADAVTARAG